VSQKLKIRPQAEQPAAGAVVEPEPAPAAAEGAPESQPSGSLVWKLAGGAVFAVIVLVCGAVYTHMQRQVADLRHELSHLSGDLRKDLGRLHESYGTMVKKHDHDGRVRQVWDSLKELRADRYDLTTLKERCSALSEAVKSSDAERQLLAGEVGKMRERKASEDERQALAREIRALRERIAQLEGGKAPVTRAGHAEEQDRP
jgi:hypothetical protein